MQFDYKRNDVKYLELKAIKNVFVCFSFRGHLMKVFIGGGRKGGGKV